MISNQPSFNCKIISRIGKLDNIKPEDMERVKKELGLYNKELDSKSKMRHLLILEKKKTRRKAMCKAKRKQLNQIIIIK